MSLKADRASLIQIQKYSYPADHWVELEQFVVGEKWDPKGYFKLADDTWETWRYAENGIPTEAHRYRIHFVNLQSFLKPYVKWFIYKNLLGKTYVTKATRGVAKHLVLIDKLIIQRGFSSLCEIAPSTIFQELWDALIIPREDNSTPRERAEVTYQEYTYHFWKEIRAHFGMPYQVPPIAPFYRKRPSNYGVDESKVIPLVVINQLVNKLALHRGGRDPLTRFHHLRLCFLVLSIILGRRFEELITSLRGNGIDGPLCRYPAKDSSSDGALWFRFNPNKNGPEAEVYISTEWEEVASYCVRELLKYSDEVRDFAAEEEKSLFILVSTWNRTAGDLAAKATYEDDVRLVASMADPKRKASQVAKALSYSNFHWWLNGCRSRNSPSIFEKWKVTVDGTTEGTVYKHRTHFGRHTRQDILAADPSIPRKTLQQDLNHNTLEEQIVYQHGLKKHFKALLEKAKAGELIGRGLSWLAEVTGFSLSSKEVSCHQTGQPILANLDERWQNLIKNNPRFIQVCRVPCGYCSLPQGPGSCSEYLNCLESSEDGCLWFFTDPTDEQLVMEIEQRVSTHELQYQESLASGHKVKASKIEILLNRAKQIQDTVLERTTPIILDRLKARQQKIRDERAAE